MFFPFTDTVNMHRKYDFPSYNAVVFPSVSWQSEYISQSIHPPMYLSKYLSAYLYSFIYLKSRETGLCNWPLPLTPPPSPTSFHPPANNRAKCIQGLAKSTLHKGEITISLWRPCKSIPISFPSVGIGEPTSLPPLPPTFLFPPTPPTPTHQEKK